ncbi:unnamed protein product, partial [Effrenium voratum]
ALPAKGVQDFLMAIQENRPEQAQEAFRQVRLAVGNRARSKEAFGGLRAMLHYYLETSANSDNLDQAKSFLDELKASSDARLVSPAAFNAMLRGLLARNNFREAQRLRNEMPRFGLTPNEASLNLLMDTAARSGSQYLDEAWDILEEMQRLNLKADKYTVSILTKHLSDRISDKKRVPRGVAMVEYFLRTQPEDVDEVLVNSLLDVFCKLGDMPRLEATLEKMREYGIKGSAVTYGTIVKAIGLVKTGLADDFALSLGKRAKSVNLWETGLLSISAMASKTRVAIVGSGIGGLVLAKTLTQYGADTVEVKLYEAWDEWKTRGGSLGVQQAVLILERLGLRETFDTLANRPSAGKYYSDGKEVTDVNLADPDFGGIIMRQDLQKLVVDSLPPEVIFLGHKLEKIVEDDKDEVTLTFANGKVEKADIVVGADGIHSVVKKELFYSGEPVHSGFRLIYSCSRVPCRENPDEVHVNWNTSDSTGYHIMDWTAGKGDKRHDVCLLMLRSDEPISDKWDSTIVKDKLKELAAKVAPDHKTLHAAIENAEMCFELWDWGVYIQPVLKSWVSPCKRVTLIGDAAHATAPFMGQGANMAILDAWRLGRLLADKDVEALKKYEAERKASAEQVAACHERADKRVKMSSFMGSMYTTTGWRATLRNWVVPFALPMAMRKARASPLKAYGRAGNIDRVLQAWEEMQAEGLEANAVTYGCMLDACVKCGHLEKALQIFAIMRQRGLHRNTILYATLIKGFAKSKDPLAAKNLYREMRAERVPCNVVVFNSLIDACVRACDLQGAAEVLQEMTATNVRPDLITFSTLIKGYCSNGELSKAMRLQEELQARQLECDEIVYNSLLEGCVKAGNLQLGLSMFQEMKNKRVRPSPVTFSILVKLLSRAGRLDLAVHLVSKEMRQMYDVPPTRMVWSCLVTCCLKARDLTRAVMALELLDSDCAALGTGRISMYAAVIEGSITSGE